MKMTMMTEIAEIYTMEELLPLVSNLTDLYTRGKSTSVSYEVANMLMEAVLYTIGHYWEGGTLPVSLEKVPAEEAYQTGYTNLLSKVRHTLMKAMALQNNYDDYGNIALRDTVQKGFPAFFRHYKYRFHPTNHIITMDYPVFSLDMEKDGIDLIADYIDAICEEQEYLSKFPREEVMRKLMLYNEHYASDIINIREIFDLKRNEQGDSFTGQAP